MPDKNFRWITVEECNIMERKIIDHQMRSLDIQSVFDNAGNAKLTHYILDVDLEYPRTIHDRDDDFPLAPEEMTIETNIVSERQHELKAKYYGAACPLTKKLINSFLPKHHYVLHSELLVFYLTRGMQLVKIHRAIAFESSDYIKPYILNNANKRIQFKDDECKKAFYKLMNNALYGKTIENVARRTIIKLLVNMDKARKLAEKPQCIDFRIFSKDLSWVRDAET